MNTLLNDTQDLFLWFNVGASLLMQPNGGGYNIHIFIKNINKASCKRANLDGTPGVHSTIFQALSSVQADVALSPWAIHPEHELEVFISKFCHIFSTVGHQFVHI